MNQEALQIHRELLEQWRTAMDLVGPGPVAPHFEDARGAVAGLDATGDWADLGSGAGFPGIGLAAAWPSAHVVLVESRQKRAVFLEKVVASLPLSNVEVRRMRVEDMPDSSLDGVISRAYKPVLAYLADADRLLRPGGRVVVLTGDRDELQASGDWNLLDSNRYRVADGWRTRWVLTRRGPGPQSR